MGTHAFAPRVVAWWYAHGRKDLPWQRRPTPYRVWLSEIMLQQTQVATVIPYYRRFTARFPGVRVLAAAESDAVLALWSGLGYYARARNLHRAAKEIVARHGGRFPRTLDTLTALPGIGRSTAGAILSLAMGQRHPILDGNVKRVLARHAGIEGWPGDTAVQRALWAVAEARLPDADVAAYTQAMMDLGATVCTAPSPDCGACPVREDCVARRVDRIGALPASRPRRALPEKTTHFLVARDAAGRLLLERRPPSGIWGGLWCFPECASPRSAQERLVAMGLRAQGPGMALAPVRHTFSHYRLAATPLLLDVRDRGSGIAEGAATRWIDPADPGDLGLAAPVARLVASLATATDEDRA